MEQATATRRLTRGESEDSPVEFVVVDSDVSMSDAGLSSPEKKPKKKRGLSFKKLRTNAQKLIPKRGGRKDSSAKSSETSSLGGDSGVVSGGTDDLLPATPSPPPLPASPTATETSIETVLKSTESLPAIKEDPVREAAMLGARSDEDILLEGKDKQRQKKARKPSRAASFMKKLAGRSKTSKVAPNPAVPAPGGGSEGDEISSGTLETPLSIKRQTPEGAMFVSDTELYQDGDRDDGTSVDPPSPVLVRQLDAEPTTLRAKRTEMKITLTRNMPSTKPGTIETSLDDEDDNAEVIRSSGGGDGNSNGLNAENRELAIDSKPISSDSGTVPSPRASIGNEQSSQLIATTRTQQSSSSTSSVDARLSSLLSGDYIAEINKFSIENITNAGAASSTVVAGGGGAGGVGAEAVPLPQPRASLSIRERFFQQQPVVVTTGDLDPVASFDSQDIAPPSSVVVDEEIDGFMRKARGASAATARSKGGSKSPGAATVEKPQTAGPAGGQQQDLSSSSSASASKAASTQQQREQPQQQQQPDQGKQQEDPVPANTTEGSPDKPGQEEQGDSTVPTEPTIVFDIGTQATMATGQAEKREHLYKILVIGELGTGKTSFIKRYVHQFFSQNYRATIGVDFALKVLNWDQNTIIRLQLWDIAGQERFGNMTRVYYKEAVGAFIVFDVTRSATFDAVIKWKNDLDSKVQLPDGKPIPCILLANKSDQQKQGIVTTPAKLDEYVKEHGFAGWFETSAKENVNIEEAAKSLVNKILMNDKLLNTGEVIDSERFALVGGKSDTSQKKSCSC
ncbi:uncharacterized protein LOC120897129 isoform X2 [Anopheles arabiensis]|uniref:uncharacterized protein LOC120897129 isoform X2 n=1 Tax=Anopheles arabiensis TaxID=7173 RepID=UPI001AAD42DF|nr:uncharacterized protein LOC120897129 isoform X2 [Anopheles arabiensis]